ncbi:MAG: PDZ domain-containing protein [Candidatus Aminicenantes bacterium]|nr:PDZ domain-containing protein [Candidatus Aminicenantes bacterium]
MAKEKVIEFKLKLGSKIMKNNKLNIYLTLVILSLLAILLLDKRFLPGKNGSPQFARSNIELIGTVMQLIKTDYLEEPNPIRTTEGAFRGLINSLDPLSAYLDKDLAARYLHKKNLNRSTGLVLYKKYGVFPVVAAVLKNSPAEKAGLKVGDNISAINDRSTLNLSLLEVNLLLEAEANEVTAPVKLRVVRGTETKEFMVEKNFKTENTLQVKTDKSGLLILKPSSIYPGLTQELKKSISTGLKNKIAVKAITLDLRNCYNGDYEEARKIINLFLQDEKIGYFEKRGQKEYLACPQAPAFPSEKLFVWINQATFGPAEMVAGVLHDLKRAKIIGLETPGLVARQENFPVPDGSLVVLTTSVFCLKSGRKLWDTSVPLDEKLTYSENMDQTFLEKTKNLLPRPD